jgi:hypothetical protein
MLNRLIKQIFFYSFFNISDFWNLKNFFLATTQRRKARQMIFDYFVP